MAMFVKKVFFQNNFGWDDTKLNPGKKQKQGQKQQQQEREQEQEQHQQQVQNTRKVNTFGLSTTPVTVKRNC